MSKELLYFLQMESRITSLVLMSDVANDAITSAKTIKADADIYTIGIFSGADVSITGAFRKWIMEC